MSLAVDGLTTGYRRGLPVLRSVDLELGEGEIVGVLGRNGVGKTTFVRCLIGVLPAWSGTIALDGTSLNALKTKRRLRYGLVAAPEGRQLFGNLTVRENLLVAQRAAKTSQTLVRDVEERFPMLREKRGQPASALSGGQQQILTLARALVMRPRYLVVDEPSLGLAPRIVSEVSQILSEVSQTGVGVLLAEQNVSLTADLCQRAILMSSDEPPREITMEDSATVNRTAREVYLERS